MKENTLKLIEKLKKEKEIEREQKIKDGTYEFWRDYITETHHISKNFRDDDIVQEEGGYKVLYRLNKYVHRSGKIMFMVDRYVLEDSRSTYYRGCKIHGFFVGFHIGNDMEKSRKRAWEDFELFHREDLEKWKQCKDLMETIDCYIQEESE